MSIARMVAAVNTHEQAARASLAGCGNRAMCGTARGKDEAGSKRRPAPSLHTYCPGPTSPRSRPAPRITCPWTPWACAHGATRDRADGLHTLTGPPMSHLPDRGLPGGPPPRP